MPQGFEEIIAQVERILRIGLTVFAAYLVALWIASVWWAFRDIRERTADVLLQMAATLLVAAFSFAGLVIYLILRPPKTLAQLYEESLEEEAFLQGFRVHSACPVCKLRTEADFVFCPWCQTRLKRLCMRCEHPMMLRWKMCPYCGEPAVGQQLPAAREPLVGVVEVSDTDEYLAFDQPRNGHPLVAPSAAPSEVVEIEPGSGRVVEEQPSGGASRSVRGRTHNAVQTEPADPRADASKTPGQTR